MEGKSSDQKEKTKENYIVTKQKNEEKEGI
jgi:hypothetical protein